jgi:uncharacterized RDD family membrane protein YckC
MVTQFLDHQRFVSGMLQVLRTASDGGSVWLRTLWDVQSVSLVRRLIALAIDWALAVFSTAAIADIYVPPQGLRQSFLVSGVFIVEVALLTGLLGFSIGKRVMGLRVEGKDGRPIGVPRALLRTVLLSLVLPAVVMTDDRRGLHDVAAGSRVIRG